MTGYNPARYGEAVGDQYDVLYPGVAAETEATVELLIELLQTCPDQSVLEFGIGTGRLALPLRHRGIRVAGLDGSQTMVDQLLSKPGGDQIQVTIGDYRDSGVAGRFGMVMLGFNGILDPRGHRAQLDIFENAARHLHPEGLFVIEALVLSDIQRNGEWSVYPRYVGIDHVELQLARYDLETNLILRTLVHLRPEGFRFIEVADCYASPGELDVMAEVSGFDRMARYRNWAQAEFTSSSTSHVSIYRRRFKA